MLGRNCPNIHPLVNFHLLDFVGKTNLTFKSLQIGLVNRIDLVLWVKLPLLVNQTINLAQDFI